MTDKESAAGAGKSAPKKLVLSLIRRINEDNSRVQFINGTRGAEIKEAVENKHLHSRALSAVARLVRMDPERRDDFLRAYMLYYEMALEAKLFGAAHVGDLVDDAEGGEDSQAEPAAPGTVAKENVARLDRGIKNTVQAAA